MLLDPGLLWRSARGALQHTSHCAHCPITMPLSQATGLTLRAVRPPAGVCDRNWLTPTLEGWSTQLGGGCRAQAADEQVEMDEVSALPTGVKDRQQPSPPLTPRTAFVTREDHQPRAPRLHGALQHGQREAQRLGGLVVLHAAALPLGLYLQGHVWRVVVEREHGVHLVMAAPARARA